MLEDMPKRELFFEEHDLFREQVRRFVSREIAPYHEDWEVAGVVPRELWKKAGEAGLLCPTISEQYGGSGGDFLFSAIIIEELGRIGASGPGFVIHSEMAAPYISQFGSETQKNYWLSKFISGESILGIAMTEPGAGSDLRNISTRAKQIENGYSIKGQKVFISNGQLGDVFIVAAKTIDDRSINSMSLFIIESEREGFKKGKNLKKIGAKAQDTSELFFDDVVIPRENLIGGSEGEGFSQLMHGLARERLAISIGCQAKAEGVFENTIAYVADRELFDKKLLDFQNTQFKLAEVKTELIVGRCMVDRMLGDYLNSALSADTAAAAKLWSSEMLGRAVDTCLQLYGGWGYMWEFPIAKAYAEARVERIAGGSSEVMKSIICKAMLKNMANKAEP